MELQKEEPFFLRTLIRKDVYERFKDFAMKYSTGRGDWDFGVAIQVLLDHYDDSKLSIQSDKIDAILEQITVNRQPEAKPQQEKQYMELLGGERIEIENGEVKI